MAWNGLCRTLVALRYLHEWLLYNPSECPTPLGTPQPAELVPPAMGKHEGYKFSASLTVSAIANLFPSGRVLCRQQSPGLSGLVAVHRPHLQWFPQLHTKALQSTCAAECSTGTSGQRRWCSSSEIIDTEAPVSTSMFNWLAIYAEGYMNGMGLAWGRDRGHVTRHVILICLIINRADSPISWFLPSIPHHIHWLILPRASLTSAHCGKMFHPPTTEAFGFLVPALSCKVFSPTAIACPQ